MKMGIYAENEEKKPWIEDYIKKWEQLALVVLAKLVFC